MMYLKVLKTYSTFGSLQDSTHIWVLWWPLDDCTLSSEDHSTSGHSLHGAQRNISSNF